ncbi:hypothetical protein SAMN05444266_10287 [Chitinophaga jiangningensis]|uniref:Uncharacterized protein n=1 Tax=Chitinophaga jiangningensis TaxID=1419482 RepID=A0A1M6XZU2_9BACT|nr:hypothetical protein [Chitinophaga jiangningensis]SHL11389.1 hypothetical protein SAMN05444266_10287 [Chitinophaga jiangningensis]
MTKRKRKNAYNVFRRSARRVLMADAVSDPEQYPFAQDYESEDDIIAFHVYLDGYFFFEIFSDGQLRYQVLTETMHPIFQLREDAEEELFYMWKKEEY